ncbi:MAG: FRG domain-containing protein [Myxococcota bacterium]
MPDVTAGWSDRVRKALHGVPGVTVVDDGGTSTVDVATYAALVRVLGFMKYDSASNILMRGQAHCYKNLRPSAYRATSARAVDAPLDEFIQHFREQTGLDPDPVHEPSTEPLLQHYGVKSRWLDLVDSIPHALFFATYDFRGEGGIVVTYEPSEEYGYIYLINCSTDRELRSVRVLRGSRVVECRGVWETDDGFHLADLRRAKPSRALRPHAQHGYLCRPPRGHEDLWDARLMLRVRFKRKDAKLWLGTGASLSVADMFPDPTIDTYYRWFLGRKSQDAFATWDSSGRHHVGSITRYHRIAGSGSEVRAEDLSAAEIEQDGGNTT